MATIAALPPFPEDWAQTLAQKRMQGRRIRPETPPPYLTADGWVLVDRRSHRDRRKAIGQGTSGDANHPEDSLSVPAIVQTPLPR